MGKGTGVGDKFVKGKETGDWEINLELIWTQKYGWAKNVESCCNIVIVDYYSWPCWWKVVLYVAIDRGGRLICAI